MNTTNFHQEKWEIWSEMLPQTGLNNTSRWATAEGDFYDQNNWVRLIQSNN